MAEDLRSRIKSVLPEIAETLSKDFRKDLNANIHILDISYEALKANVYNRKTLSNKEQNTYDSVYNTLLNVVRSACTGKTFNSIDDPLFLPLFNQKKSAGVILIEGDKSNIFLVGKSYSAIQSFVSAYISRNPKLKATRFGTTTDYKQKLDARGREIPGDYEVSETSKVDIGHTSSADNPNLISPLEKKIDTVLTQAMTRGNTRVANLAKNSLKELYDIQAGIAYQFKNTSPENIDKARKVLGTGYIVVTMHTRKLNQTFAKLEKQIYDKLVAEIALSVNFKSVPGSNSIIQDVIENTINTIRGSKKKLVPHKTVSGKETTSVVAKPNITYNSVVLGGKRQVKPVPINSTASLEALLRARISLQVKENMGTGNAKNVLNYRTGRFAESVSIEKLSTSRAGMVSVFYNYMRNPYGTFSNGGAKEYPKTRDPKLLISKSIREIGASIVGNRLRAVLV